MAKAVEYNAELEARVDLTDSLAIFRIRPDEALPQGDWFVPGQYCVIGLNNEEKPDLGGVQRPMSIASAPQEHGHIEFYIRYVPRPESDNPLTHLLWKRREGDRVYVRAKPKGRFTLDHTTGNDDDRLRVFVSAGTGLAPFVSIVRDFHNRHPSESLGRFGVLHGASYPADLGYRAELEDAARSHGLHYLNTISRPHEAAGWEGHTGRVEDFFLERNLASLEAALGLEEGEFTPERVVVYICGLQGTIGQTLIRLASRGFIPENKRLRRAFEIEAKAPASLFYEQYDSEPVVDLEDEELVGRLRADYRRHLG